MMVQEMNRLRSVDVRTVDRENLVDIRDVEIDRNLPVEERVRDFLNRVKNPYCFKVGNVVVKAAFNGGGECFEERFKKMLFNMK